MDLWSDQYSLRKKGFHFYIDPKRSPYNHIVDVMIVGGSGIARFSVVRKMECGDVNQESILTTML